MDESALQLVSKIGTQILRQSRPTKDFLVKSLRQTVSALVQMEQPSTLGASLRKEAVQAAEVALKPLREAFVKHSLAQHKDKDVRLLVAVCASDLFRVMAPNLPFEDRYIRDMFKLFLSIFTELADMESPYFSKRVKILETIARCKCFVVLLDIGCSDLILEMFNIFFTIVREQHQQSLISDMLSVLAHIIHEEASEQLLEVILQNLLKEEKGASSSCQLARSVIQTCSEKLEPYVCRFLTSCLEDRENEGNELRESYHQIIFEVYQCTPQMLLPIVPNLIKELTTDQVDDRIKAVNLIGKIIAAPRKHAAEYYRDLFVEFLKRFSDKSVEVRIRVLQYAKDFRMAGHSEAEVYKILEAVEGRLLDIDDRVRIQAVIAVCDLARSNLNLIWPKLISQATERLRDKKISVRKKALQKLIEVYRYYCNRCSEGFMKMSDDFEQIPCKILLLCYDKDCREFSSQNMELLLVEELFPPLSPLEKTKHWVHMFSLFSTLHTKALNSILHRKRRLQADLQSYVALRRKQKQENGLKNVDKSVISVFKKVSSAFSDQGKAEECLHKLYQMKDDIFNAFAHMLDELSIINAQTAKEIFLKKAKDKYPHAEFLHMLTSKCLYNIFGLENVQHILDCLSCNVNGFGSMHLNISSVKLLQTIAGYCPVLLRSSEDKLCDLLEKHVSIRDSLIEFLAKAGSPTSVKLRNIYHILERICLEGTRSQSKVAVSAIAALGDTSEELIFPQLCKQLVNLLHCGKNMPTVLQSLGSIAQHSVETFDDLDGEITPLIYEKIFQPELPFNVASSDESSGCIESCKLKIYGLKTLVKSFLPHGGTHVRRKIDRLLSIITQMLQTDDAFDGVSLRGDAGGSNELRLGAAKSVLRLSRRWDLHISPEIFRLTILVAKDSSCHVRRLFIDKTNELLKEHAIPMRYACAFALAFLDSDKVLQKDSFKYMAAFIKDHSIEVQSCQTSAVQGCAMTKYPVYIVVFLLHVLASDPGFPSNECEDEQIYAYFCSPLFYLIQALLDPENVNGNLDLIADTASYLASIFRAIMKAEDAVDAHRTPRLHVLSKIGISFASSLNSKGISSLGAPAVVLLPSLLYKVNPTRKSGEAVEAIASYAIEEGFTKKIVDNFKHTISMPEDLKKHGFNKFLSQQADPSVERTSIALEVAIEEKLSAGIGKPDAAGTHGSIGLRNIHSRTAKEKNGVSKYVVGDEQPLSSGGSTENISLLTKSQKNYSSLKDNAETISTVTAGPSAYLNDKLHSICSIKKNSVGDLLCLESESQQTVSNDSLEDKTVLLTQGFGGSHSQSGELGCSASLHTTETICTVEDHMGTNQKHVFGKEDKGSARKRAGSDKSVVITGIEHIETRTRRRKL